MRAPWAGRREECEAKSIESGNPSIKAGALRKGEDSDGGVY
jgi:hypothetical protein